MKTFDNLQGGTMRRLAAMRRYVTQWNADAGHVSRGTLLAPGMAGLLQARSHGIGNVVTDAFSFADSLASAHGARCACVAMPGAFVEGWRDTGGADELLQMRHTGWYADSDSRALYCGHVWQLPARAAGVPRYVAGYIETEGRAHSLADYCVLELDGCGCLAIYADAKEAARAADGMAESNAESARNYDERWQAARDHADARDEARGALRAARADASRVVAAWRAQRTAGALAPAVCELLRAQFDAARERMSEELETLATESDAIDTLSMRGEV
jgi:hypothetical protein